MKKTLSYIGIYILVILATVGITRATVVYAQGPTNQYVDQAFNSKPTTFRLRLRNLLEQHTVLTVTALKQMYKGEDTSRLEQMMNVNQTQIASLVENAYGKDSATTFNQLWKVHMQEYMNYTNAKKNNDATKMSYARKNLQITADRLGNLLASENLHATTISNLMMEHINGTLSFVDAVAANNTTAQADIMQKGYLQAGQFADTLIKGILMDKPQLFQ